MTKNKHTYTEAETEAFIKNLRHVTLSKTEAHDMRERLIAYADMHAVPASTAHNVSPFSYLAMHLRASIAVALVLLILVGGTGVTYAAQDSLPGQPLYAIKVDVTEPIQTALITAPVAKAQWQNTLAARRLAEASTLAARGDLATSTQQYLADAVATHVQLSERASDTLAASGNNTAALAARSDLEAQLSAHADVLALMTARFDASGEASSTTPVLAFLQDLQSQRTTVELSREATEVAISDSATSSAGTNTESHGAVIAYVANENSDVHTKEAALFKKEATSLGLFAPMAAPVSSTSASTTATSTEKTASTTDQELPRQTGPWYRFVPPFLASSTISTASSEDSDK